MLTLSATARVRALVLLLSCVTVSAVPFPDSLVAQDAAVTGWNARVVPYLWLSNVDGRHRFKDVDETAMPVGDSALHAGIAARLEVWRGQVGGVAEYSRTTAPGSLVTQDRSEPPLRFDLRVTTVEFGGMVRVGRPPPSSTVVLLGGGRYIRHARELVASGVASRSRREERSGWLKPFAGARFRSNLGGGVRFSMSGSISRGISSDFSWEIDGEVTFRPARDVELGLRYLFRETDFDGGSLGYRWTGQTQGFLFGLGVHP